MTQSEVEQVALEEWGERCHVRRTPFERPSHATDVEWSEWWITQYAGEFRGVHSLNANGEANCHQRCIERWRQLAQGRRKTDRKVS